MSVCLCVCGQPSLLQAGESWWLQKRCSDSFARAWWETVRGRDPNLLFDAHFDEAEAVSQLRDLELQQSRVGSDKAGASHLALPNLAQLGVTDRPGMGSAGPGGSRGPKEGQVGEARLSLSLSVCVVGPSLSHLP